MPPAGKRTLHEIANKSDSSDDDYNDHQPRTRKKPKSKQAGARSSRRRPQSKHDSDESDDPIDDVDSFEASGSEQEDPTLEVNASGRPKRGAAKSAQEQPKYRDPSSEDESQEDDEEHEPAEEGNDNAEEKKRSKRGLVIKFRVPRPPREASSDPPARTTRSNRARSGSAKPSDLTGWGNRRSTRRMNDESEDIIALSGSGRHVETVRRGTHSPEVQQRPRRSTTGVAITEEQEEEELPKKDDIGLLSQVEVMESDPRAEPEAEATAVAQSDPANNDEAEVAEVEMAENDFVPESQHDEVEEEEQDEEEEEDVPRSGRRTRSRKKVVNTSTEVQREASTPRRSSRRIASKTSRRRQDDGSDFEPNEEEANEDDDDVSDSPGAKQSPRKSSRNSEEPESGSDRRTRLRKRQSQSRPESDAGDLVDELAELKPSRPRRRERPPIVYEEKPRRTRKSVDYRIIRPELALPIEEAENEPAASPSRRGRNTGGSGWQRGLFSTSGPFGGAGGLPPLLGAGPTGMGATGGVESDSSDDEGGQNRPRAGGATGMASVPGVAPGQNLGLPPQTHGADAVQGASGTPANLGKVKDKQTLADSDPLGVDPNVNFDGVGGMQGHIDQLKEMVSLPLLYPEIFQRFHIVPPRGVLFHGPPGTGKTLLARALASSVSSEGRKVTFYMRKGADALSKWVGEAERQLRLLFEEARKNQPSIIFFDEIDGLAPVRSSKQEQIHASIVSTLLALMDGMDGRGQVIVIGATNRPDSVDPALRRPGRFDREFYFPLPSVEARRSILDIHTRGWDPPLPGETKEELAELTKGYGGADLRALCTEAALNAVQRKYPQIYRSNEKLLIDPKKIDVGAKDFMMSIKKIVPSSERSASSGATPLPETVEPLLRDSLRAIKEVISEVIPMKKNLTALEEAQFEEPDGAVGFRRERMQHAFESSRVFRPRMLIHGKPGMGQGYVASGLLNHFEGMHVQSFDLSTLLSDSTRSPEATVVQLFTEVKRHKPSVIYIPDVDTWYDTVGQTVISTFLGMLRSLSPTDQVLLLGVAEMEIEASHPEMVKALFGYSKKNSYSLKSPENSMRREFFQPLVNYIKTAPSDFPDPSNRKRRKLETLEPAPPPLSSQQAPPAKEELKAQKKKDRQTLNLLKVRIQPIMDQIKKYKRFRTGVIDDTQIRYLFDDDDPNVLTTDLPLEQRTAFRPFEKDTDKHGVPGLREVASSKFFFNMDIVTIEKRLSNGYYKRPKDFLDDIKRIAKDAQRLGDQDRLIKANELLSNVEVDIGVIEQGDPNFVAECENVFAHELERERLAIEKAKLNVAGGGAMGPPPTMNVAHGTTTESNQSTAPVVLGEAITDPQTTASARPVTPSAANPQDPMPNGSAADQFEANPHTTHQPGFQVSTSNGSNSTNKPSTDHDGDVQMSNSEHNSGVEHGNTQNSSFGPSAQPKPPHSYTAPSQQLRQQSGLSNYSQKDTVTPMAPGSQPGDYVNEASTTQTTSDKKHSGLNSGPSDHSHNQSLASIRLSGQHEGPDLNHPDRVSGDENLPDTQQGESSWASSQQTPLTGIMEYAHSQASGVNGSQPLPRQSQHRSHPPVPHFDGSPRPGTAGRGQNRIHELLNTDEAANNPTLTLDEEYVNKLHSELTSRTSGCSVEQMEQINTNLMDCVWRARGEWDRSKVVDNVQETFNDVLVDMQILQDFGPMSQMTKDDITRSRV